MCVDRFGGIPVGEPGKDHPLPIRMRLAGDNPVAMDNFGMDLTFFEAFE